MKQIQFLQTHIDASLPLSTVAVVDELCNAVGKNSQFCLLRHCLLVCCLMKSVVRQVT